MTHRPEQDQGPADEWPWPAEKNTRTDVKAGPGSVSDPGTKRGLDEICERLDIEPGALSWISPETAEVLLRYPPDPDEPN